jgi:hypothetical protein
LFSIITAILSSKLIVFLKYRGDFVSSYIVQLFDS